jgi:hypothetical protein
MAKIRWKLITIAIVFVVFAGVGVYPIVAARYGVHSPGWLMDKQLKLGLDLNGGVQLVLRVQTDDALKLETDTEMERLRAELAKANIPFTNLTSPDPTHFRVEGIQTPQDAAFRQAANEVQANFDRGSAGTGGSGRSGGGRVGSSTGKRAAAPCQPDGPCESVEPSACVVFQSSSPWSSAPRASGRTVRARCRSRSAPGGWTERASPRRRCADARGW